MGASGKPEGACLAGNFLLLQSPPVLCQDFPEGSLLYGLLMIGFCLVSVLFSYGFYRMFEVWRRHFKARALSAVV